MCAVKHGFIAAFLAMTMDGNRAATMLVHYMQHILKSVLYIPTYSTRTCTRTLTYWQVNSV